jgi:hypothetical protein
VLFPCLASADNLYNSLQLLELGRGILANLQLELRSDISILEVSHPDLANQFREVRDLIDVSSGISESSCSVHQHYSNRMYKGYSMESKNTTFISMLIPSNIVMMNGIRPEMAFESSRVRVEHRTGLPCSKLEIIEFDRAEGAVRLELDMLEI